MAMSFQSPILTSIGTRDTEEYTMVCANGTKIALIDTPGFNDLHMSDMEVLQSIIDYTVSKSQQVIAALYLHRIVDRKITGSAAINLRMLRAVCGEHFYQNVALATSMWSAISSEGQPDAEAREVELNTSTGFWGDMFRKGAQYYRWDEARNNHTYTAKQMVELCKSNTLRKNASLPNLQIMLELERGVSVEETSAGHILTEELRKRQERERKALEDEEEDTRALEQEHLELTARLQTARGDLRRDAEAAARRAHGPDRTLIRRQSRPQEVVVASQRRPGSSRSAEMDRYEGEYRRPGPRDSRSRADSEYYEDGHRRVLHSSMRRQSERDSRPSGWLRSFGLQFYI